LAVDDPRMVLIGVNVHAAVFLEANKPQPVVLFERVKGCCPAGPVCQTLKNQIQSKPLVASRSSSASGMSSSVAGRPRLRESSVNQTRVLIW
jgi:hypothetical protein